MRGTSRRSRPPNGGEGFRACLTALVFAAAILSAKPAAAQTLQLRISRPLDLLALPLVIMQHEHLIERTAEAMGVGAVHVAWSAPDKNGPVAALAGGEADLAMVGLAPLLLAADVETGKPDAIRAIGSIADRPYILVTSNPAIRTILDFTMKDRIAVPALRVSEPALLLEMAAAQEWGPAQYARLDPLMVPLDDGAADDALVSGKGGIDTHFSQTPYADDELAQPKIHRVMDSFDIMGPHSVALLAVSARFQRAHPELCKAILAALQAADDYIRKQQGRAAEIFAGMVKGEDISVEDLTDMIGDPDLAYDAAPAGVSHLADFMYRVGRLKHRPTSWRDYFIPEARDLKGS